MGESTNKINQELILHELKEIKDITIENRVAIVGKDGNPGLVGKFNALCTRVDGLDMILHNDLAHIQAKMDIMFDSITTAEKLKADSKTIVDKVKDDNTVTWSAILKDWVKPVITAVLTAILVYFVVTNGLAK